MQRTAYRALYNRELFFCGKAPHKPDDFKRTFGWSSLWHLTCLWRSLASLIVRFPMIYLLNIIWRSLALVCTFRCFGCVRPFDIFMCLKRTLFITAGAARLQSGNRGWHSKKADEFRPKPLASTTNKRSKLTNSEGNECHSMHIHRLCGTEGVLLSRLAVPLGGTTTVVDRELDERLINKKFVLNGINHGRLAFTTKMIWYELLYEFSYSFRVSLRAAQFDHFHFFSTGHVTSRHTQKHRRENQRGFHCVLFSCYWFVRILTDQNRGSIWWASPTAGAS